MHTQVHITVSGIHLNSFILLNPRLQVQNQRLTLVMSFDSVMPSRWLTVSILWQCVAVLPTEMSGKKPRLYGVSQITSWLTISNKGWTLWSSQFHHSGERLSLERSVKTPHSTQPMCAILFRTSNFDTFCRFGGPLFYDICYASTIHLQPTCNVYPHRGSTIQYSPLCVELSSQLTQRLDGGFRPGSWPPDEVVIPAARRTCLWALSSVGRRKRRRRWRPKLRISEREREDSPLTEAAEES